MTPALAMVSGEPLKVFVKLASVLCHVRAPPRMVISVFLSRGRLGLFATLHQPGCQGVTCAFGGWLVWVWRCCAWPTCLTRGVYKGICCVSTSWEWEGPLRFISFLNNICQAPTLCQMFLLGIEEAAESKIHPQPLLWYC